MIQNCIGSGIWKSYEVFLKGYHFLHITPFLSSLQTLLYCIKKKKCVVKAKVEIFRITFSHKKQLSSLYCRQYFRRAVLWPKRLAFALSLLLHKTGLLGLYTKATKYDDTGYKRFTLSLVISVACTILLRLNSLDLH